MKKNVFLLLLVFVTSCLWCSVTFGASCDPDASLLQQCAVVLIDGVENTAIDHPEYFTSIVCNEKCAKPLHELLLYTDPWEATLLDFLCAYNSGDNPCLEMFNELTYDYISACSYFEGNETYCTRECSSMLQTLHQDHGCCLYTFNAFMDGKKYADFLFDLCSYNHLPAAVCTGGASETDIKITAKELLIYESCSYLLNVSVFTASSQEMGEICEGDCATNYHHVWECISGQDPKIIDSFCFMNEEKGKRCWEMYSQFEQSILSVCDGNKPTPRCYSECITALERASDDFGCCLASLWEAYFSEVSSQDFCGVKIPDSCEVEASASKSSSAAIASAGSKSTTVIIFLMFAFM